jgi:Spy/CpxP family protein refolding chaperone
MKIQRIAASLALTVMLITSAAVAQGPRHGRGGPGMEFRGLNLTAEQKTQMKAIHEQARAKMTQLDNQALTRAQYRAQAAEIHKSAHDQVVNTVLTQDQRAQIAERQARRQQRYNRGSQNGQATPKTQL